MRVFAVNFFTYNLFVTFRNHQSWDLWHRSRDLTSKGFKSSLREEERTNKDIIAQVVSASIAGDMVLATAYAHELPQYGLKAGLTNYAAAYCTGLLLARRVLKMLEMDQEYLGNVEATGEDYSVEPAESRRPFRALLDVGLLRTTTGNRVFGALKGALDGGLDIPHSEKRFAGFSKDGKQLDAEVHRKYIYGGHVAAYMRTLMEDEPEKYQTHFSEYVKAGVEPDTIEEVYKKVHAAIRADPTPKKSEKQPPKEHKRYNLKKLTYDERREKLIERLNALNAAAVSLRIFKLSVACHQHDLATVRAMNETKKERVSDLSTVQDTDAFMYDKNRNAKMKKSVSSAADKLRPVGWEAFVSTLSLQQRTARSGHQGKPYKPNRHNSEPGETINIFLRGHSPKRSKLLQNKN
ncbi:ribosomal protein L18/L5, Ribosomal protein L5 eukaryotic/L18 archaeal [Artemisia annua]|uniref:Ribosomal protein L18/L5, Ribosomal protein L5 eukaryotic/L18 archaeal n=1 Tax=Artemisia annua TaxID=35608 RepID=A0A2U1P5F0_ARTAN|nr:ribosomal protein L18/L5, Ribosomal protein L5 eukaryotic/L18 archaeal [Artemisia annua]